MFNNDSRYKNVEVVTEKGAGGREVRAVKLRRLSREEGVGITVQGNTRLDILSKEVYNNPTKFWHIADANTELEAAELTRKTGRVIQVPEN